MGLMTLWHCMVPCKASHRSYNETRWWREKPRKNTSICQTKCNLHCLMTLHNLIPVTDCQFTEQIPHHKHNQFCNKNTLVYPNMKSDRTQTITKVHCITTVCYMSSALENNSAKSRTKPQIAFSWNTMMTHYYEDCFTIIIVIWQPKV